MFFYKLEFLPQAALPSDAQNGCVLNNDRIWFKMLKAAKATADACSVQGHHLQKESRGFQLPHSTAVQGAFVRVAW